jgi:D-serine deaminase-like pyridoxal phosphate-dependent protein
MQVLSEKCKRMKILLAKSKQMAQESKQFAEDREEEMKALMEVGSRPKRFGIQARLVLGFVLGLMLGF